MKDLLTEPLSLDTHPIGIATKMRNKLEQLRGNGPIAALCDWNVHLKCVQQMIPFFHASDHFAYAKSCHLYLQDMLKLPSVISKE
ncbi:hypothetical protein PR048_021531 [Dryococelus australis]|uniref:Uncharacterized protein n=1 Tax=Dryococelus australis TaxID=614101 RepID=A0ABQ9GYI4_9NEOP|nr:hypothetical protein PR048_021531 [Dryococelus australis]